MIFTRHPDGPIITRADIPEMQPVIADPSAVFNPGAVMVDGRTILLLRVQTRGRRTFTVPAVSEDGIKFKIASWPVEFIGLDGPPEQESGLEWRVFHIYDPRITLVDDELLVVTAIDTTEGCRLAVWRTAGDVGGDFAGLEKLEFVNFTGDVDTRNGVIFPETVGGCLLMLDRPNRRFREGEPPTGSRICLNASADLDRWDLVGPVLEGRPHFWDEMIGPGTPPIRTEAGWLAIYHGVATHFQSQNIYQAGAVLLDLAEPVKVIGRTRDNILEPRLQWELTGQVPNVVFPSGWTVVDGRIRLYYGAADTAVGLATASLDDVIAACV